MNFEKLEKFIDLAKKKNVSSLKYEEKDFKISVDLTEQGPTQYSTKSILERGWFENKDEKLNSEKKSKEEDKNVHVIKSPFVGTFYTSPSPGSPSFTEVGKKVSVGQTLCILEAMKIMNEIESDVSGEVVEVCVENESLVEFGQILFKIKK